jgi:tRNA-specific 2-thiouridylase
LRPLSAQLLPETNVERAGTVDRNLLQTYQGRGREAQHRLARSFGWDEVPAVTSGCLLADAAYAHRTRDLLHHWPHAPPEQFAALRWGRHYRDASGTKFIVGRKAAENEQLAAWFSEQADGCGLLLTPADFVGPTVVAVFSEHEEAALLTAAQLAWKHRKVVPEQSANAEFHARRTGGESGRVSMSVEELAGYDESRMTRL